MTIQDGFLALSFDIFLMIEWLHLFIIEIKLRKTFFMNFSKRDYFYLSMIVVTSTAAPTDSASKENCSMQRTQDLKIEACPLGN